MRRRMGIKEAAIEVGLSEWELRQGIRIKKYPAMRVGIGRGKYIVDIDILNAHIDNLMLFNIKHDCTEKEDNPYSGIRKIS